jgi:hypothetical protein
MTDLETVPDLTSATGTTLRRPIPVVTDPDEDPLSGIPAELLEAVGCFDSDTAGGCG